MTANFWIQTSRPRKATPVSDEWCSLCDVLEDLYCVDTEDAFLCWNGVRVSLNYKYDIAYCVCDLTDMLLALLSRRVGQAQVAWPSQSFRADWHLAWDGDELVVEAKWHAVSGGVAPLLAERPVLVTSVRAFVAEWVELVRVLSEALAAVRLPEDLLGFSAFTELRRRTADWDRGRLYAAVTSSEDTVSWSVDRRSDK